MDSSMKEKMFFIRETGRINKKFKYFKFKISDVKDIILKRTEGDKQNGNKKKWTSRYE